MSGYVTSKITIHGDKEKIKELFDYVKNENVDFDIEKVIPIPKDFVGDLERWKEENWGLAFLASTFSYTKEENGEEVGIIEIDTIYSTIYLLFSALQGLFPNLEMELTDNAYLPDA